MRVLWGAFFTCVFLLTAVPAAQAGGWGNADGTSLRAVPPQESAGILDTVWVLEDIQHQGVIDRSYLTLQISPDGQATGDGGCNRFSGTAEVTGDQITFGMLMMTRRACAVEAMQMQENKYTTAFERVRQWRIENGLLHLMDDSGQDVLRFYAGDKP